LEALKELIQEFDDVFSHSQYDLGSFTAAEHSIETTTEEPVFSPPRRMPHKYRDELRKHIEKLLASGVMVESDTPWVTPFVPVLKKDGGMRPCLDFRKLNEVTVPDRYPLPRLDVIMEKVGNCKYYSALDLSSGYLQIRLTDDTSRKCGVITEDKIYQMLYMPFGMKNATAAFSRAMAIVLSGLEDCAISYVDDILIFTKDGTFAEHLKALRTVLGRFRTYNLKLSPKKCKFATTEMNFLGFTLTAEGYKPSLSRIELIKDLPVPKTVREVKRVLGKVGFYRRHIANFSTVVEPLQCLTRQENKFEWNEEQQKAFELIKELLSQAPNLIFPDYDKPFHIFTDASLVGLGGVLMQKKENSNTFSAISYCSRTLSASERKWPPVQVELCAIIYALREFRSFIFMSDIELHTDHKPLAYLLRKADTHPNLARWLIELQNYQIKIVHISGKQNTLADALSRDAEEIPIEEVQNLKELEDIVEFPVCLAINPSSRVVFDPFVNSITLRHEDGGTYEINLALEQSNDPEAAAFIKFLEKGEMPEGFTENEEEEFAIQAGNLTLNSGILYFKKEGRNPRIYVPLSLRTLIFESLHNSPFGGGHMSIRKTFKKCCKYFWPQMHRDITMWVKQCITCQLRNNPTPANRAEMQSVPTNTLFAKIGMDLAGPFPTTARGNKYILNIICWFTKYVISVAIPDAKGKTIARAYLENCYLKYGGCTEIITDCGTAFTSGFFRDLCSLLYIGKTYSIPHWSQGNSVTERTFRTFHNILSKYISKEHPDFDEFLSCASFCYNTSVHVSTGETPFFLMYGRDPIFAIDQVLDSRVRKTSEIKEGDEFKEKLVSSLKNAWTFAAEAVENAQKEAKLRYDKKVKTQAIRIGDRVLLRNYDGKPGTSKKFHLPWKGIYRVIAIEGVKVTVISCLSPQSNPRVVHINQIKKCFEYTGPACTVPVLPEDEEESLQQAEAEELVGMPGFTHICKEKVIEKVKEAEPINEGILVEELEEVELDTPASVLVPEVENQPRSNAKYQLRTREKLSKPARYLD
jgi:hypothetical protein